MATVGANGPVFELTGNSTSSDQDYTPTSYDPSAGHSNLICDGVEIVESINGELSMDTNPSTYGATVSTIVDTDNGTISVQISGLTGNNTGRTFLIMPICSYDDGNAGGEGDPIIKTFDGDKYSL